jgi:protein TonB
MDLLAPAPDSTVDSPEIASCPLWPSEWLRAPVSSRLAWIGFCASVGTHVTVTLTILLIAWLGWIDSPARLLGRRAVVTMESIAVQGQFEPVVVDVEPIRLKSEEPLDTSHATEPLKIEVTPDHVRIQEQVFAIKTKELVRPELEISTLAASSPAPPSAERVQTSHQPAHKPESHERPVTRPPTSVLAAVAPAAMHAPSDTSVGIEDTPARLPQNNPPPIYPAEAVARRWYGRVELRVTIAPDGTVAKLEIAVSSGYPVLDGAAYQAVRRWRFIPGSRLGVPVQSKLRVPVDFLPPD